MINRSSKMPLWQLTNAWREILVRIFEGVETRSNVFPEWLVNPVTNRRLKLDLLYPELGLAIRFEGLQGKERRQRPSLEEEAQQQIRDEARADVCRSHGIELVTIGLTDIEPQKTFRELDISLSRAKARPEAKENRAAISQARATAASLARRIKQPTDLRLYADLWEDRQYQVAAPVETTPPAIARPSFTVGMAIEHVVFGPGVIRAVTRGDDDTLLTVDFESGSQKVFIATLVADKLFPT